MSERARRILRTLAVVALLAAAAFVLSRKKSPPSGGNVAWVMRVGGPGADEVRALSADGSGDVLVAATTAARVDLGAANIEMPPAEDAGPAPPSSTAAALVARVGSDGKAKWTAQLGPGVVSSIAATNDGGAFVLGIFGGGEYRLTLMRIDSKGARVWSRPIGKRPFGDAGVAIDRRDGGAVLRMSSSGAAELGDKALPMEVPSTKPSEGADEEYVVKIDANGDIVWARRIPVAATEIVVGVDGTIVIVGDLFGPTDFGAGALRVHGGKGGAIPPASFVAALDQNGKHAWSRGIGSPIDKPGVGAADTHVALEKDGSVHLVGAFRGSVSIAGTALEGGELGQYEAKLDPNGNVVRAHVVALGFAPQNVVVDDHGKSFVSGWVRKGACLVARLDEKGKLDWTRLLGEHGMRINAFAITSRGTYAVGGSFKKELKFGSFTITAPDAEPDGFVIDVTP